MNQELSGQRIVLEIAELQFKDEFITNATGFIKERIKIAPQLWSPDDPKLYKVIISTDQEIISDEIGFRSIKVKGQNIYLNNSEIQFKGISMHSEPIGIPGPAFSKEHFQDLLFHNRIVPREIYISFSYYHLIPSS